MHPGDQGRLELLLEVARLLSSKLDLEELLRSVLELASRVVDAETASLLLLDEKAGELYFDVALGLGPEAEKVRLPLGRGIAGAVALSRKPEIINAARADPRWSADMDRQTGFVTRSILAVPILVRGKLVGVVEAINKRGGDFSPADLASFEAFASQAGVAIENARLFAVLKEERFKLSAVFSQMADAALVCDAQGRVLLANEASRRLLNGPHERLAAGFSGMAVTPPLEEVLACAAGSCGFAAVRKEPTLLVLSGRATRAPLAGGGEGRIVLFRDDTEAWRQETLKRTFLSLISHKLKTPLAAVTGYADILFSGLDPASADPSTYRALKAIREQGDKLAAIVEKLLRYTILESPDAKPQLEPVPVDEAVSEALKSLRERLAERKARVDYKPGGLCLLADRAMAVEVVKNLVDNAVKFSEGPEPPVAVRAQAEGDWVALSVADAGPGIPPEDQERVFSRFHQIEKDFTGQKEGVGLGLAYVKKVAQLHGGAVELRSKLGAGTTVTVTFPRRRAP